MPQVAPPSVNVVRTSERKPVAEPYSLATGWVEFDYDDAFGCPVRLMNDACMQALGSYEGGEQVVRPVPDDGEGARLDLEEDELLARVTAWFP